MRIFLALKFSLLMVFVLNSSSAFALFDGQLLIGQRRTAFSGNANSETINSSEVQLAAHVDPIPLIPVSFGAYYLMHDYSVSKDGDVFSLSELKGSQIGLEVSAWLNIPTFDLNPYAKIGYTLLGNYKGNYDNQVISADLTANVEQDFLVKGTKLAAGLKWSPIAIVSGLFEVNYATEVWSLDELRYNGSKINTDDVDDIDAKAWTILVGVEAGL
jgi:hypothetical protein